jgi:tRNA-dihydrouridine synthase
MIRTYFKMLVDETMHGSPGKMKQFVAWFTHGVPGGNALRRACYDAHTGPAILASVEKFFEELLSGKLPPHPETIRTEMTQPEMDLLPACGD